MRDSSRCFFKIKKGVSGSQESNLFLYVRVCLFGVRSSEGWGADNRQLEEEETGSSAGSASYLETSSYRILLLRCHGATMPRNEESCHARPLAAIWRMVIRFCTPAPHPDTSAFLSSGACSSVESATLSIVHIISNFIVHPSPLCMFVCVERKDTLCSFWCFKTTPSPRSTAICWSSSHRAPPK